MSAALKPNAPPLVKLRDLHVTFKTRDRTVHAVNGVDLDLAVGVEFAGPVDEKAHGRRLT